MTNTIKGMESKDLPGIVDASRRLLESMVDSFGPWGTVGIIVLVALATFGFRYYNDRRKDRDTDRLLEEKDRTIQRLAESERSYRIFFFKQTTDWSDDQIERFVTRNEFANPVEAREALEGNGDSNESTGRGA